MTGMLACLKQACPDSREKGSGCRCRSKSKGRREAPLGKVAETQPPSSTNEAYQWPEGRLGGVDPQTTRGLNATQWLLDDAGGRCANSRPDPRFNIH